MTTTKLKKSPLTQLSLKQDLEKLFTHLTCGLVERDLEIRLAVLAALAGEHILLIGPPGTAKSEIARRLVRAIGEGPVFERLLTRFSVPEELFGPLSIKALEDDRYERRVDGYLPTAQVAFIDEIFKANSAILNSLLTLLNERQFDNGTERIQTPLVTLIGASNELPEGEELQALYDRFLVRRQVLPTSNEGFVQMLRMGEEPRSDAETEVLLSPALINEVQYAISQVKLPHEVVNFIGALRKHLNSSEIYVSDRRWRKAVKLLQTAAYTNGQDEVTIWDCKLLEHCLWNLPEEREVIAGWYESRIGLDDQERTGSKSFERLTTGFEQLLDKDRSALTQAVDKNGKLLFFDAMGKPTSDLRATDQIHARNKRGDLLYLAPNGHSEREEGMHFTESGLHQKFPYRGGYSYGDPYITDGRQALKLANYIADPKNQVKVSASPFMVPQRFSNAHIKGRKEPVQKLLAQVNTHITDLEQELKTLETRIEEHLWLEKSFTKLALASLTREQESATKLKSRLQKIIEGFDELPIELETMPGQPAKEGA